MKDHPNCLTTLYTVNNFSLLYAGRGHVPVRIERIEERLGSDHTPTLAMINKLGQPLRYQGKLTEWIREGTWARSYKDSPDS